jgi:hypothetical protein
LLWIRVTFDVCILRQGNSQRLVRAMNKTIGLQLTIYSLLLAGLSCLAYHLAPALARPTLITGLVGGALCLAWGLRAIRGSRSKGLPILTLIPLNFLMLSQTLMRWTGGGQQATEHRTATALIGLLLVLSLAMVVRIAWAGVVFDVPSANPPKEGGTKPQATGKPALTNPISPLH